MNAIRCELCKDIIIPLVSKINGLVRHCECGFVEIRAVPKSEELPWIVEVKLYEMYTTRWKYIKGDAKVIKINNHYLSGELELNSFCQSQMDTEDLFYQNLSQIVIAPLDTPGVKVVDEWSDGSSTTPD